jgi:hypothetical protein
MNRAIAILLLLLLTSTAFPSFAEDTGEQFTDFLGFHLGTITLAEVEKKLGPAKLIETGDAGGYEAKICYKTSIGLVYFLSGEMGGSKHELLGFAVSKNDEAKPCSPYPSSQPPPMLELAGLRLGMTKANFSRAVRKKVQWEDDIGRVFFESKRPITPAELAKLPKEVQQMILDGQSQNFFDVLVSIIGYFSKDRLTEFQVWKVETQ